MQGLFEFIYEDRVLGSGISILGYYKKGMVYTRA
jgi:hypothetical protein